jgi:hypothetical protein
MMSIIRKSTLYPFEIVSFQKCSLRVPYDLGWDRFSYIQIERMNFYGTKLRLGQYVEFPAQISNNKHFDLIEIMGL